MSINMLSNRLSKIQAVIRKSFAALRQPSTDETSYFEILTLQSQIKYESRQANRKV